MEFQMLIEKLPETKNRELNFRNSENPRMIRELVGLIQKTNLAPFWALTLRSAIEGGCQKIILMGIRLKIDSYIQLFEQERVS